MKYKIIQSIFLGTALYSTALFIVDKFIVPINFGITDVLFGLLLFTVIEIIVAKNKNKEKES